MKSKGRQTFLFYRDWYDTICKLDDSTALEVCKAIMSVAFGEEPKELSNIAEAMMLLIRPQIERDIEKWNDVRAKRQEVGRLGGLAKATNCYQLLPNDSKSKQNLANVADNVDVDINVNVENNSVPYEERKDTDVSIIKKDSLDFSAVSPDMIPIVEEWLAYKKERRESYKPRGFKTFYKRLCELSSNDPQKAMAIIEQSMANNYAGIFELKQNSNYGRETITDKIRRTVEEANKFSEQQRNRIGKQAELDYGDNDEVW